MRMLYCAMAVVIHMLQYQPKKHNEVKRITFLFSILIRCCILIYMHKHINAMKTSDTVLLKKYTSNFI